MSDPIPVSRGGRIVVVGGGWPPPVHASSSAGRASRGASPLSRPNRTHPTTAPAVEGGAARHEGRRRLALRPRGTRSGPAAVTPATGVDLTERVVRTVDDALALRSRLQPGALVVVSGASWIGAEVATAALARGCHVGCVEAGPAPLAQALGTEIGAALLHWWRDVELHLETKVRAVTDGAVALADGSELPADVVVVGVGVRPETGWLASSGLSWTGAWWSTSTCGRRHRGWVAVGDVAARWSPRWQTWLRVEHWDDAVMAPAVAATTSTSATSPRRTAWCGAAPAARGAVPAVRGR